MMMKEMDKDETDTKKEKEKEKKRASTITSTVIKAMAPGSNHQGQNHEPLLSAMKIGIEAKERVPNPRSQKDLSEI